MLFEMERASHEAVRSFGPETKLKYATNFMNRKRAIGPQNNACL
jgi:hypothetical protein